MPMDNVGQLVAGAGFIAGAISERFMPPWPASDAGLDFHGDRHLTDQQIQRVVEWVEGGAVVDVPENTPVVPTRRSYEPVEPDVTMTGAPYRGTLDLVDDYHHLRVECSWDRSLDDHGGEARYIFWAHGTIDEMCY
jgi:hypothetical protein